MAVLPWGHSRNHTNNSTEKSKVSTLDWFSRSNAEPSRQAINQLMKQHSRGGSGGSVSLRSQSRAGTPTSQQSQPRSGTPVKSRRGSSAGTSLERVSASHTRPVTPVRSSTSGIERSDSASKSLFQKGGLLRKTGSKISMNLNTNSPGVGVVSPPRPISSRAGLRGKEFAVSPTRDEGRRPSISKPYDFAHIMHGDSSCFAGLGRIDESDLASQFDAIQARYRTTTELGGPLPQKSESSIPTQATHVDQTTTALPQISPIETPNTPPPAPPPKDSPPIFMPTTTDIRVSRSTENFSRPTPRSPTTPSNLSPIRPSSSHIQHLVPSPPLVDTTEAAVVKPLPQLPTVIHAVSTQDDTALMLISAPLPVLPANTDKPLARHHRQSSSRSSLRHMSTFPSARFPQNGVSIQDGQLLDIKEEDGILRPHSDYQTTHHIYRRHSGHRMSMNHKSLKTEDWEVAIDSAWDMEDEADLACDTVQVACPISTGPGIHESYVLVEQPTREAGSSPSTPLMTMSSANQSHSCAGAEASLNCLEGHDVRHYDKKESLSLIGLGIETDDKSVAPPRVLRQLPLEVVTSDISHPNVSPRLPRSARSAISHSSSQESIILSIASSIMSTQRSSISSISVSDYAHTGKYDRSSIANSSSSPFLNVSTQKAARPESSCLPSALLQQMNLEVQKAARPDSTCLPPIAITQRTSSMPKEQRPESVCLPQDILAVFPIPETRSLYGGGVTAIPPKFKDEVGEDNISALPTDNCLAQASSGPRGPASQRTSYASNGDGPSTARQRSNTQGSRTRPTRVSYSLFPIASTSTPTPTNIEIDGVAS